MTESIHRLVYYSRNRVPGGAEALADTITSVLAASRINNLRAGVTGALMFNAGCFAQVLEGRRQAVEDVFERIQQDDRHGDVSLLAFDLAPGRAFANWSMGFVGASINDAAKYAFVTNDTGFDPTRMTGEALFATLHRLALEEEPAA